MATLSSLTKLAPANYNVNVISPPARNYSTWIGGSMLASTYEFDRICMKKREYEEYGANIVYRKCI